MQAEKIDEEKEPLNLKKKSKERPPVNHLLILTPTNPFRRFCTYVATSKGFDWFIMLAIVFNCVLMAMNSQLPGGDQSIMNRSLDHFEIYLLIIFIGECFFKIITQGFVMHPGSYLRNGWNILDFIVVITGILGLPQVGFESASTMKVIKAARVLRPLKLVSGLPSLQVVMTSILKSMASLLQICLLIGFVIVMYGIVGLSLFMGKFHKTCFFKNTTIISEPGRLCGSRPCPDGTECREYWDGPNAGITSYDNILIACLTVFTCITCEGWTTTMYMTFDVYDAKKYYIWIYYYTMNIIGSQFMLNLVLGVLSGEFSREKDRVENRNRFEQQRSENASQRAAKKYSSWVDSGDLAHAQQEVKDMTNGNPVPNIYIPPNRWQRFVLTFKLRDRLIRAKLKKVMTSQFMYWLVISIVFCNSVSGAVQHYGQPQWTSDLIELLDLLFMSFFFMEMCLKLYAFGPRLYFSSKFNTFDFTVVICGACNLISSKFFGINLGISVLRQLRLMRLFKFTQQWGALKNLINSLLGSMTAIMSLLLLLFLFLMISALLGMQLFGGYFQGNDPQPRTNFDDFFNAMLAVFQIITGEDWNFVMYDGIIAHGGPNDGKGLAHSLYFVGVTVLGNYVLLNVFLAIAVDNLTMSAEEEEDINTEEKARTQHLEEIRDKYKEKKSVSYDKTLDEDEGSAENYDDDDTEFSGEFDSGPMEGGLMNPEDGFLENLKNPGRMTGHFVEDNAMLQENTLFICFPTSFVRIWVHKIVTSAYFDNVILTLILISSMLLACENVTDPQALVNRVLLLLDYGFTSIFFIEVLLKVINMGFILHKGSYCRNGWNCIDMIVVCSAVTSLVLKNDRKDSNSSARSAVKILRMLRVLRPLKSINKLPKLKAVFQCMIYSLKNVVNILIITLQFLFIFSVMGVQLFMGKFWYCNDPSKVWEEECQGTFIDFEEANYYRPIEVTRTWQVYEFNFDNIQGAMVTLFASSTGEGWPSVMQNGIDSQEFNQGPILNSKLWISIYFIIFVIIFSFFFINIFVGMIILTFQEQGDVKSSNDGLDKNMRNSLIFAMKSEPTERYMPDDVKGLQYRAWVLIESTPWELSVMGLIFVNTIIMMCDYYDQPMYVDHAFDAVNDVFTFIFIVELVIKLFALSRNYFKDGWNIFDMLIVVGSLIDFSLKRVTNENQLPFDPSIFRLFRAARLVKLLRRSRSLRILLWTFVQSFKALPYVSMLISLLFFVYGIFGVQMFALISIDNDEEPWNEINRNNHFRTYFAATQVLFRVATGESWPNIMLACRKEAKCDYALHAVHAEKLHCGSDITYFYFVSFVFLCSFLMLNLFIAVIMDSFAFLTEDSSILGPHHLDEFVNVWSDYDPRASGRIKHSELCGLLRQMFPPIGLGSQCPKLFVYKRLVLMNMTLYQDGTVDYTGTFFALVRTGLSIMTENANLKSNDEALKQLLKKTWPKITKRTLDLIIPRTPRNSKHMTVGKIYTAKMIWENYKNNVHNRPIPKKHEPILIDESKKRDKDQDDIAPSLAYNFAPMLRRLSKPKNVQNGRKASRNILDESMNSSNGHNLLSNSRNNQNGSLTPRSLLSGGGLAPLNNVRKKSRLAEAFGKTGMSRLPTFFNRSQKLNGTDSNGNDIRRNDAGMALRNVQTTFSLNGFKLTEDEKEEEWF